MATIVQAPFWVPRPADTPIWTGGPRNSAILSQLLTAQGQVEPRLPWNFGAFRDDPPVWSGGPTDSALLANLLTAAGQVKPRQLWNFTYDDPSVWTGTPTRNPQLTPSLGQAFPRKPWAFDQRDDAPVWSGAPLKSAVLAGLLTIGGQTPPRLSWNFGTNDPPVWQFLGQINRSLANSLIIANPFVNPPWTFGQDVPAYWVGTPARSAVLANLLTAGGQILPRLSWNFGVNDPPAWQFVGQVNRSLVNSLAVVSPFVNLPWKFGQDDYSVWAGTPIKSPLLLGLLTAGGQVKPRKPWNFEIDDASVWNGGPIRSSVLAELLTAGGQSKPRVPWNFGLHESPPWHGQPLPNQERNLLLLTTQVSSPFKNVLFSFGVSSVGVDYSAFWTGAPLSAYTMYLPTGPVVPVLPPGHQANYFFRFGSEMLARIDPIVGPYLLLPGRLLSVFVYDTRTGFALGDWWCCVVQKNPLSIDLLTHPNLQFALDREAQFKPGPSVIVNNIGATLINLEITVAEGVYANKGLH